MYLHLFYISSSFSVKGSGRVTSTDLGWSKSFIEVERDCEEGAIVV